MVIRNSRTEIEHVDFSYYISFFHDGSLDAMKHKGNRLECEMSSAELMPEENLENIRLDEDHCIRGRLIIEGIRKVSINDCRFDGQLEFPYDDAEILDFEIRGNEVELGINWRS